MLVKFDTNNGFFESFPFFKLYTMMYFPLLAQNLQHSMYFTTPRCCWVLGFFLGGGVGALLKKPIEQLIQYRLNRNQLKLWY